MQKVCSLVQLAKCMCLLILETLEGSYSMW